MVGTVLAAVINLGVNFVLIQRFGYMSAAYTTLACYIMLAIFQHAGMVRVHGSDPFNSKLLLMISVMVVVMCMGCVILYKHTLIRWIVIMLLGVATLANRKKIIKIINTVRKK